MMTYIVLLAIVLFLIVVIALYNSLVRKKIQVGEAWSDIQVQLKRRYDLIPNIVESVKGYTAHEKNVLEDVTNARAQAMNAKSTGEKAQAENFLSQTLKSLFAVAENYPNLKANENFLSLQQELSDTENKIQASRRFYNAVVRDYNTAIKTFPSNIMAGFFSFTASEFFGLESEAEEKPVEVKF